uniref:dihydrofolate reductase family protein n=1 Tax=Pseudonocardia sp. ICBG601 TaxID=2846759 RepID=UPI001CF6FAAE
PNSTLLAGDAAETVAKLKNEFEGDLTIIGSGALVRSLHAAGLMDSYTLLVHPIAMGSGRGCSVMVSAATCGWSAASSPPPV